MPASHVCSRGSCHMAHLTFTARIQRAE
jgi:hypothetical protein